MKAARWHGAKDIRVEEIAEPVIKSGMVKIKVEWCGICGSDLHEYLAGPILIPDKEPHYISKETAPLVMGHEFSGQVIEIGDGVTRVQVGDRVAVEPILSCGECDACRLGRYNLCDHLGFHGLAGGGGGFSEVTMVKEHMVHKLPDGMSYEQGALVEPAAVALHSVRQSRMKAGDKIAVFGAGPIGLLTIQAAKAAGASEIYVIELSEERKAFAEKVGATTVLDPSKVDVVSEIRRLTNGGVDVAFEVTGVPVVLQQAIDSTTFDGETVIVSIWETEASIQPNNLVLKERNLTGIIAYRNIYPAVMKLISQGQMNADLLITKKISLGQIVEEGFEALVKEKNQVKILVKPS
ncbi:2,3-butanediol dehydrogenase [Bacillus chungangensis]|uniref:(R,R)-butanediol dehydrogenase/meso-butanediol dehydrogenase/diacetyl reductase n=1 Tax=Bacillus chungangensis TaxID=587633 RepID=A0ABT9WYV9_9BACI|nr:2,3-butanediol dehydrogenase [Bacillus chungangensis]MDQ0178309.1 (R,R)-butanediol dehydrogenase/meso-butanediol dehydrogenase/diacetyl reductase [Bacillus chungangensis]